MSDCHHMDFASEGYISPADHLPDAERLRLMHVASLRILVKNEAACKWLDTLTVAQLKAVGLMRPASLEIIQLQIADRHVVDSEDLEASSLREDRIVKAKIISGGHFCIDC